MLGMSGPCFFASGIYKPTPLKGVQGSPLMVSGTGRPAALGVVFIELM